MEDTPKMMDSLPDHPLSETNIKNVGESDAVVGAMPFPDEDGVRGFLLERKETFTALVFDHRTETWRKLGEYDTGELSIDDAFAEAVSDRTQWFAETGRLEDF